MEQDPGLPTQAIWDIAFESLEFHERIGKGSFGSVFKGSYLGLDVAIKKIEKADDPEYLKYIDREVSMLQSLRHPYIVNFSGICVHTTGLYIITEYVSGGDVRQLLKQDPPIGWDKRIAIAVDLAKAMVFLHAKKIIHRDLKSKNILLDEHQKIRLCDFGFARMSEQTKKSRHMTMCGTEGWVAPEILLGMSYDTSCDVFSYGVVLAELITGRKPGVDLWVRSPETCFDINPHELKQKAFTGCPSKLIDICNECCMYEPLTRPKFEEVLSQLKPIQVQIKEDILKASSSNTSSSSNSPSQTPLNTSNSTIPQPTTSNNNNNPVITTTTTTTTTTTSTENNDNRSPDVGLAKDLQGLNVNQSNLLLAQSRRNTMAVHRKSMDLKEADLYKKSVTGGNGESGWRVGELKPAGYYTLKRRQQQQPQNQGALSSHIVKMIERATSDYYYDTSYIQDLLLTYRCFTTPKHIFELLLNRYIANSPENFMSDLATWKKVQKVIQLRVIIFLKRWIDYYPHDFSEESMEDKLLEFDKISTNNNNALINMNTTIATGDLDPKLHPELLKKRIELDGANNGETERKTTEIHVGNSKININTQYNNNQQYPVSIIPPPPTSEYLEVVDIHPHELSRQLTIIFGKHYKAIQPREFLEYNWEKLSDTPSPWVGGDVLTQRPAQNIHVFTDKYKDMVRLITTEIVKNTGSLAKRVSTIERFIEAAEKSLAHFDYSSVFCIMEALSDSSIERLSETFKSVSPRILHILDTLKVFVSKENDCKKYRESLQDAQPPCIPYVSLLLDEVTFIETSSPKLLPGGIVNFFHYRQLSRKILQSEQLILPSNHYFRPIPSIQKTLSKPTSELFDAEVTKHYSLLCEPPVSI